MMSIAIILSTLTFAAASSGHVAFVSGTSPQDNCVCVMDVSSGTVIRVGTGHDDGAPVWSPDGTWLAFETHWDNGRSIAIVRPDGSDLRLINHASAWNFKPRWSPEGKKLAYSSDTDRSGRNQKIVVFDLETQKESVWGGGHIGLMRPVWLKGNKLLSLLAGKVDDIDLTIADEWPDNTILAIGVVGKPGEFSTEIFVVAPGKVMAFPQPEYFEWAVEPDPKGRRVLFESNDGGDREIFIISEKGLMDLTNHRAADWNPVWSKGGRQFAFESFRDGRRSIYRAFYKTPYVFPVVTSEYHNNWSPTWAPDEKTLAFVSDRTGNEQLFVCDSKGKQLEQLTNDKNRNLAPAWCPVKLKDLSAWRSAK